MKMDGLDYHNKVVAHNVFRLREKFGVSQKELAKVIGVSFQTVSKMEKGISSISRPQAELIAKYFKVPVELFYSTNHEHETDIIEINNIYLQHPEKWDDGISKCESLILKLDESSVLRSMVLNLMGKLYMSKGIHKQSYLCFLEMYNQVKALKDKQLHYQSAYNLSLACYYLRDYKKSLQYIDEVLKTSHFESKYKVFMQRSILLIHEKRFDEAIGCLNELRVKYKSEKMYSEYQRSIHNIGFAYDEMGEKKKAKIYYRASLMIANQFLKEPDAGAYGVSAADLAAIYISEGNYSNAEKVVLKALSLKIPIHLEIRLKYKLALCTNDTNRKKELLLSVVDKTKDCMDHKLVAKVLRYLSNLFKDDNDYENAFKYRELVDQRQLEFINNKLSEL